LNVCRQTVLNCTLVEYSVLMHPLHDNVLASRSKFLSWGVWAVSRGVCVLGGGGDVLDCILYAPV